MMTRAPREARRELYEIMRRDASFEEKAEDALELGRQYLGAANGHLTLIDTETDHWEAMASTDPPDGEFPVGLELDLETTYCRRTLADPGPVALHDAPAQGWADDPAVETHDLHCYHGTTLLLDDEPYGTVCFVDEDPRDQEFTDGETMFAELVTRLLERELERDQYEAELTRQSNLTTVLNRVLRHNLRNDMTVIRGRLEQLRDQVEDDTHGEIATRKIDDLLRLSQKARELERIVGEEHDRAPTNVADLVDTVVQRAAMEFPSASFTVDTPDDITAPVLPSFQQALEELVENAARHAGATPAVTVTVEYVPNAVEVSIADDGPGLSEQEREVLRTGEETALIHDSGLGLWLVHLIVSSHDGTVSATVTDAGTEMTLSIPRVPETDGQRQVTELTRARNRYQAAFEEAFDAMLIVDDEARIVDANSEATAIYGRDEQDLLGRPIQEFLPADLDFESAWADFRTDGSARDTVTIEGADGVDRPVEYAATTDIVPGQHLLVVRELSGSADQSQPDFLGSVVGAYVSTVTRLLG